MEYELFRSQLKHSVDGALVSEIIRGSSSGLNSHRTAAIELIIEGSIRERRERIFAKAKNSPRSDPTPQTKRTSVAPNVSIPKVQPLAPAPAPQPPSQSLLSDATGTVTNPTSASAKYNASPDSPAPPKRAKGIKVARSEKPPADVKTDPSPPEDPVELECWKCGVRQPLGCLWDGLYCRPCPGRFGNVEMKCVGCGATRADYIDACTHCHRTFR